LSLEFNRIVEQVYKMGAMLQKLDFDLSQSLELASERFEQLTAMERVRERIEWVRSSDISGYRGAAPLNLPNAEPVNLIVPEPAPPARATLLAADGGQVYPDEMASVHYYLINIGLFIYHHGSDLTPEQFTFPDLRFHKNHVHDRSGRLIRNRVVDDRRTVSELRRLADEAWQRRSQDVPLVALYDNRLMYLPGSDDSREARDLMSEYIGAMVHLHDAGANLAGYIDNPIKSKRFLQLLYLLSFESREELRLRQSTLARAGDLEGLRDSQFFFATLKNGERSAVMVQSSPQNKEFKDRGENYEIAFFYLKVYNQYQSRVVRVDIPIWVARDPQRVSMIHALLLHQCRLQGRNPYPYAITRADELAWVGGKDRSKLEELVNVQVRRVREELIGSTLTAKTRGKDLARSAKRYHDMRGDEIIDER
jgi:hypothetical protein